MKNIDKKKKINQYQIIAWLICGLGALYYSYEYLLRITPSVMETAIRNHFDISKAGFGFLAASYYYAYVPMQLPVGILMDRFGPKILLTFACAICVIGTFLFGGTSQFEVALIGRFLVGFGSAFAFVGVLKLATIWLPENKLGMVAGIAAALGTIGAMIGDNVLGELVINLGWQPTVNLTAIIGLGLVFVLWIGIPSSNASSINSPEPPENLKKNIQDLKIISKNKQIWVNGFYGCLVYLPTTVFAELWGIPYMEHALGFSKTDADLANSFLFLGFTIGAPLMGFISDKLRKRKLPMLLGASCASLVMMIILYVPGLNQLWINSLMFLLGLLYGAQAIVFAVARELSPNSAAGTAVATTNMIVMIGAMFLQPLVGQLLDWSARMHLHLGPLKVDKALLPYNALDYQLALSIIPIGMLIAALLTFFLRETHAHTRGK